MNILACFNVIISFCSFILDVSDVERKSEKAHKNKLMELSAVLYDTC